MRVSPAPICLLLLSACELSWGESVERPSGSQDSSAIDTSPYDSGLVQGELEQLPDPCQGVGPIYSLFFPRAGEGWVGCGNGAGLHFSSDSGESWQEQMAGNRLYVFDVREDRKGRTLVCGHAYDGEREGALLMRYDKSWKNLLYYGKNSDQSDAVYMSNCGQVAVDPKGRLVVFSNTIGDMSTSTDDGQSWSKEYRYWEQENLSPSGYSAYQVMRLEATSEGFFGSGSTISEPPLFFSPASGDGAPWYTMAAEVVSSQHTGEIWAMATPDGGARWVLGGRDQVAGAEASGFLFVGSSGSWKSVVLGPEIDIVRSVAFSGDGQHGIAVGDRFPPQSKGGFALITSDAGLSWQELNARLPSDLQRVAVQGQDYWIGGNGYLARGHF